MEVNVSDYATEEVLSMKCENKQQRLVAYLLKSLNETEKNYNIYDKEMLVVIRELENWRHLLVGAKFKFKVQTNHKNLEYIPGTKIKKVNELSKRLDQKKYIEKDNENQTLIKE